MEKNICRINSGGSSGGGGFRCLVQSNNGS